MIVYAEANFVLELALQQEQHEACEHIVDLCSTKRISLIVPAYSIAEPYKTIVRRGKQRKRFNVEFNQVTREITRSEPYKSKDFKQPQIINALEKQGCKLLFSFEDGYSYIRSQTGV